MDGTGGVGGSVRLSGPLAWQEALDAAAALDYAGYDDWRLPNAHELSSLVDFGRFAPALDTGAFPDRLEALAGPYFWSSTSDPTMPTGPDGRAFYVNIYDGHLYPWRKTADFMVRPVRDAPVADPVAILRTGQTIGYGRDDRPGAGNGDDGDLQRGLAHSYGYQDDGVLDTPAENVVHDLHTGLTWLRDSRLLDAAGEVGGNVALTAPLDWQAAVTACMNLSYDGHDDWRLPNIRELASIVQPGRGDAVLDPDAFPNAPVSPDPAQPWIWWSATTAAMPRPGSPPGGLAWYYTTGVPTMRHVVASVSGSAKSQSGYARCVRDTAPPPRPDLYLPEIRASADFLALTVEPSGRPGEREGKYLLALPKTAAPFTAAFQDVHQHPLHYDFLLAAFPATFAGLTPDDYTALVARRATRRYYAGALRRFSGASGEPTYGFDVYVVGGEPDELLSAVETGALYDRLARAFRRRPLAYAPISPDAIAAARAWSDPGFPVDFGAVPPPVDYEAYTPGETYGTVRLVTLAALPALVAAGSLGRQDLVVLDRTPTDLDVLVAGIVTGERQAELSHLNIRSARRGTPNAYVQDAHAAFRPYADRLVRLTAAQDGYAVNDTVSPAEAAAWWFARRPAPVTVQAIDRDYATIDGIADLGLGAETGRVGGKAANLARLYSFLPPQYQVPGLAIPFRDYVNFAAVTTLPDRRSSPPVRRLIADQIAGLAADPRVAADAAYRAGLLDDLRTAFDDEGEIHPARVLEIAQRLEATFGPGVMVRFRSSSNAEDDLRFNGAGLYDSTSVCAADSLDADTAGPSRCDAGQPKERSIERGLRRVWASLWNQRAWDERAWYGIPPTAVAMAVLVTPAFPDERANGVAFTGLPTRPGAGEYLVNVQQGDTSVVLPEPGVLPERVVLEMQDGQVTTIRRVQASTLVPEGQNVLSDDELRELGSVLALADREFPLDLGGTPREDVLLDAEFKLRREDDQLIFKQIRPFLTIEPEAPHSGPTLRLEVPHPVALCSLWRPTYPVRQEHEEQAVLALAAGTFDVPLDRPNTEHRALRAAAGRAIRSGRRAAGTRSSSRHRLWRRDHHGVGGLHPALLGRRARAGGPPVLQPACHPAGPCGCWMPMG